MDIQRMGGGIPPEIPETQAEEARVGEGQVARGTPSSGVSETGSMVTPTHDPGIISATPIQLPYPNPEGPGQPGPGIKPGHQLISATPIQLPYPNPEGPGQPGPSPVIDPGPQRGEAPPVKFMDTRLEIAAMKGDLLNHVTGPIPGHGQTGGVPGGSVPISGPRPGPDPGSGGVVVFGPGLHAEQDVPPNPKPEPDPDPDPIQKPGRELLQPQFGTQFVKAQLLQELANPHAQTTDTLSPENLKQAGDHAEVTGPVGPRGNRAAEDDDEEEEPVQLDG
jgi:hypothetical protein